MRSKRFGERYAVYEQRVRGIQCSAVYVVLKRFFCNIHRAHQRDAAAEQRLQRPKKPREVKFARKLPKNGEFQYGVMCGVACFRVAHQQYHAQENSQETCGNSKRMTRQKVSGAKKHSCGKRQGGIKLFEQIRNFRKDKYAK